MAVNLGISYEAVEESLRFPFETCSAVVVGGGTGAPISIKSLLELGVSTSAVVAMADDGGSTGVLRDTAGITPPGDIRKCLLAFAANPEDPLTRAFGLRFDFTKYHALGNLMLAALEETTGSFSEAIRVCEGLLNVEGRVYPSTLDRITLCAQTQDGEVLHGQAKASASKTALQRVWLESVDQCRPYQDALTALELADLIVLGPGSLYTSIIPNLLVPGVADAIRRSRAKTVFVCSLADMQGETWGLSALEHVEAILDYGMQGRLDYVLIHSTEQIRPAGVVTESFKLTVGAGTEAPSSSQAFAPSIRRVPVDYNDLRAIQDHGPRVLVRNMVDKHRPTWHDPETLGKVFEGVLRTCRSPQK